MDLATLIVRLARPEAFPFAVNEVEVRQTHISVVFLAGAVVYKIKKPVQLGFLDFGTLDQRRHFCKEELRLNRRLAPSVYLGVVPVTLDGGLRFEGTGKVCEWAVKMTRLPDEATLEHRLGRGEVSRDLMVALARKVADFHKQAERSTYIASYGKVETVAGNVRENFNQSAAHVGITLSRDVYERLVAHSEEAIRRLGPVLEDRARRGLPCDTHGDMHLDHVYLFPERRPPDDLVIIDCIEFNERFRFADPVADMAFLYMDLKFHGRHDLAEVFADEYFRASADKDGRRLLPFYSAYRAAVRGKVEGFEATEAEVPFEERSAATARARAHWLLALGELSDPSERPCLILVGGLPGSGKSTLAANLARRAGFVVIRSDVVRKELALQVGWTPGAASFGEGIYTAAWTEKTYAECLRHAETELGQGRRVLVDATFGDDGRRRRFLDLARGLAVPGAFLWCQAPADVIKQRLATRKNDVSDADWNVHLAAAEKWQHPSPDQPFAVIDTAGAESQALQRAVDELLKAGCFIPHA